MIVAGDDDVDLARAVAALGEQGAGTILAEGGPTLNGDLARAGLLDELCVTPRAAARERRCEAHHLRVDPRRARAADAAIDRRAGRLPVPALPSRPATDRAGRVGRGRANRRPVPAPYTGARRRGAEKGHTRDLHDRGTARAGPRSRRARDVDVGHGIGRDHLGRSARRTPRHAAGRIRRHLRRLARRAAPRRPGRMRPRGSRTPSSGAGPTCCSIGPRGPTARSTGSSAGGGCVVDDAGEPTGTIGVALDVTEREELGAVVGRRSSTRRRTGGEPATGVAAGRVAVGARGDRRGPLCRDAVRHRWRLVRGGAVARRPTRPGYRRRRRPRARRGRRYGGARFSLRALAMDELDPRGSWPG